MKLDKIVFCNTICFYVLVFFLGGVSVVGAKAQSRIKVINQLKTDLPVSRSLYGSYYELGFGRSDLLWGELLFNRDFELTKPLGEKNPWLTYSRVSKEEEDWWHSGYEEQKWYVLTNGVKQYELPLYHANYWPSAHGKYFVYVDTHNDKDPFVLAQDRIFLRDSCAYNFSGLFAAESFFNAEKYLKEGIPLKIRIFKEDDFDSCIWEGSLEINTYQFNKFELQIPPLEYQGWCTFTLEIPSNTNVGIDFLSLSAVDDICGWKKEAVERIKNELRPKSMRLPGGCFASLYDWRDGIGPRELRPVSYDTWWGCELVNDVGTVELVDLCHAIGAEPFFCVPVMFNDAYNAAEWVDFCNNPSNERRIAYGRKEPLKVQYWELENEPYRRFDALTFAKRCVEFSKLMKSKDPSIKIAVGNYWIFNSKFKEMLEIVGPYVDLITNRGGSTDEMLHDIEILNDYNKKHGTSIQLCHTEFRAPLSREEVGVDGLNQVQNNDSETLFNRSVRWEYGLSVIDQYVKYQNMGGIFYTANFTNLIDGWGENLMNDAKEGEYLSAAGVAFSLLTSLDIVYPLSIEQSVLDKNVVVQSAWDERKTKLTLLFINFNSSVHECKVDLHDIKSSFLKNGIVYQINPRSLMDFNSTKYPDKIKLDRTERRVSKDMTIMLAPFSVYAIELYCK